MAPHKILLFLAYRKTNGGRKEDKGKNHWGVQGTNTQLAEAEDESLESVMHPIWK